MKTKKELMWERHTILVWLKNNDYIINKVFLGEWQEDDERFIEYKKERALKRNKLEELNRTIESIK
jgi:hypothetical protein